MTASRPPAPPQEQPLSRRAEYRQATIDEIKALARRQLADHGVGGLSLRAIARQMRTASSALYRYFATQQDLVSALCVDAYESLADAITAAEAAQASDDHAGRWLSVCHAYRRWSLDHPAEFALIFGTPVPGYQAPEQLTAPAAGRSLGLLVTIYADAVRAGAADPDRSPTPPEVEAGPLLRALLGNLLDDTAAAAHSTRLAAVVLSAYTSLLGYLIVEIFGSLTSLVTGTDQLYNAHVRTVTLGAGFDPALLQATDPRPIP
jgi:AcrR family transcriptional regulator